ncbi:MAG: CPBP family intramembrane metalloprotease [Chloroflexales bacterium]|nr:CPBP family intramembrane metalloprotease [Chloroflexales bacterium]
MSKETRGLIAFLRCMSRPWSKELGWRGCARDLITAQLEVIPGVLLLGLIWGVWHLTLVFMPATGHGELGFKLTSFWTFTLYNMAISLLMT